MITSSWTSSAHTTAWAQIRTSSCSTAMTMISAWSSSAAQSSSSWMTYSSKSMVVNPWMSGEATLTATLNGAEAAVGAKSLRVRALGVAASVAFPVITHAVAVAAVVKSCWTHARHGRHVGRVATHPYTCAVREKKSTKRTRQGMPAWGKRCAECTSYRHLCHSHAHGRRNGAHLMASGCAHQISHQRRRRVLSLYVCKRAKCLLKRELSLLVCQRRCQHPGLVYHGRSVRRGDDVVMYGGTLRPNSKFSESAAETCHVTRVRVNE